MRTALLSTLLLATALAACDPGFPGSGREPTISEDTFVATMVELRRAAGVRPGGRIAPADRDRILAERGVGEEDLLLFVEVHGPNVPYMEQIWVRIEAELRDDPLDPEGEADPGVEPGGLAPG